MQKAWKVANFGFALQGTGGHHEKITVSQEHRYTMLIFPSVRLDFKYGEGKNNVHPSNDQKQNRRYHIPFTKYEPFTNILLL